MHPSSGRVGYLISISMDCASVASITQEVKDGMTVRISKCLGEYAVVSGAGAGDRIRTGDTLLGRQELYR